MNKYFLNRYSVRTFSSRNISDRLIKEMIEAASHAPTTGNMQLYSVIITRDLEKKARLAPAHFSQPAFMNAPVVLTFCADFNRFNNWCRISNAAPGYDNVQSFIAAALDAVILAQQFVTIAEMAGLGTCYLGTATYNPDIIADVLDLPEFVVPVASLAIGYPESEGKVSDRLPVEAYVHNESYKVADDDTLKQLYALKESLEENKQFVLDNKKETLAQIFTDIRYPRSNNEHFSETFVNFLRNQGFLKK